MTSEVLYDLNRSHLSPHQGYMKNCYSMNVNVLTFCHLFITHYLSFLKLPLYKHISKVVSGTQMKWKCNENNFKKMYMFKKQLAI